MVIAALFLAAALAVLVGILVWLLLTGTSRYVGRAEVEVQTGIEVESSRLVSRNGHIELWNVHRQTLLTNDGRAIWQLDLENSRGIRRSKCFCGSLILGRAKSGAEPAGVLYLDEDATVSKEQCEVIAFRTGVAIQNRSHTSMTKVDGRSTREPVQIRPGSIIAMGRSRWKVVGIRPR